MKTKDGVDMTVGMKVYLYPANNKRGGTIGERVIHSIQQDRHVNFVGKSYLGYDGKEHFYTPRWHSAVSSIYSTKAAAEAAKAAEKIQPKWFRNGKFHITCTSMIIQYLASRTGLPLNGISVSKTPSYVNISWADKTGLKKYKLRAYRFGSLTEDVFNEVVQQMTPEQDHSNDDILMLGPTIDILDMPMSTKEFVLSNMRKNPEWTKEMEEEVNRAWEALQIRPREKVNGNEN
jgi:hypothetical protein